ncbi:MAG: toll/interleukin-1 receptor domain-containing protein [Minicystis sp.]
MPIIRTFISHAHPDKPRVHEVLRRVAPYGVRPWIDEHDLQGEAGSSLSEAIPAAIGDPSCRSLSLFLSADSAKSTWVQNEVGEALARIPDGWRIIPIMLDPPSSLTLPQVIETALRKRGSTIDTMYLEPTKPRFVEDYAASVLRAGGATEAEDIVLHLGHREPHWQPNLPAAWSHLPALDLRLRFPVGEADFSPTDAEWAEIRAGFDFLRGTLRRVQSVRLVGRAPLGVGVVAGRTWDRGTTVTLEGWNGSARDGQAWTSAGAAPVSGWTPSSSKLLPARTEGNIFVGARKLTVAFLRRDDQAPATRAWNASRSPAPPLLLVKCPEMISSAAEATAVLSEALGVFSWVRTTCTQVEEIDLVLGMPLALDALLAHHLRQVGRIHFYDQVLPSGSDPYRLAISWS